MHVALVHWYIHTHLSQACGRHDMHRVMSLHREDFGNIGAGISVDGQTLNTRCMLCPRTLVRAAVRHNYTFGSRKA